MHCIRLRNSSGLIRILIKQVFRLRRKAPHLTSPSTTLIRPIHLKFHQSSSRFTLGMSEPQRIRIANWIPDASSTIDEGDEHDTYATSSTFSQFDAFTDDTATAYP